FCARNNWAYYAMDF
nr:immunoglobulin heavy chain junction region [Mus musculus]